MKRKWLVKEENLNENAKKKIWRGKVKRENVKEKKNYYF